MIENNKEIGARIRARRKELKKTGVEIAEESGLATTTIYRYESGDIKRIKLAVIERLAEILQVNPAWLLCKTDEKRPRSMGQLTGEARYDARVVIDRMIDWLAESNDLKWGGVFMNREQKISLISSLEAVKKIMDKEK